MAMDGTDHLYQRRIMSQAFKKPKLVAYLETMNPVVDQRSGGLADRGPRGGAFVFGISSNQIAHARSCYPGIHGRGTERLPTK